MTSFTSLLSAINGKPQPPQNSAPGSSEAPKQSNTAQPATRVLASRAVLTPNNAVAGSKRKAEDASATPLVKSTKIDVERVPAAPSNPSSATARISTTQPAPYRGTARPSGPSNPPPTMPKLVPKRAPTSQAPQRAPTTQNSAPTPNDTTKPKRGFASIMEKAKAAQAVAKVSVATGIKHKPVERLSRREKARIQEESSIAPKQKQNKLTKALTRDGVRPTASAEVKNVAPKRPPETGYKGTMKKAAPESSFKGTMRAVESKPTIGKSSAKKGMAQDRYGGYASWSDLDDAEDDEEEEYESDVSSDMEGGFDEMEREETEALRTARKEDQLALEEEERLKKEKLDRKRKLLELSKNAAAKRR